MSLLLNICSVLVSVQQMPDQALQQMYRNAYHCNISAQTQSAAPTDIVQTADQINRYFPAENSWWPVFTLDQVNSKAFQNMLNQGIHPGVIIPKNNFSWGKYKNAKYAVNRGAIPVIEYQQTDPHYFAAKAIFATALGMRPLAAYVPTGWDPNIIMQPSGTYIIRHVSNDQLPLPARPNQFSGHTFYNATVNTQTASGMQIIINPPESLDTRDIQYPEFDISWKFYSVPFHSDAAGIHTGVMGYALIGLSLVNIPIDLILNSHYPNILTTLGSSISWVSLILGISLFIILIISIVKRVRENGSD